MNDVIIADNEDARTINELRLLGPNVLKAAKKGKGKACLQVFKNCKIIIFMFTHNA